MSNVYRLPPEDMHDYATPPDFSRGTTVTTWESDEENLKVQWTHGEGIVEVKVGTQTVTLTHMDAVRELIAVLIKALKEADS